MNPHSTRRDTRSKKSVLLFNPRAGTYAKNIPNSLLALAAVIEGVMDYVIVDGNLERDPTSKILDYLLSNEFMCFGCTVMPGPQLRQALTVTRAVRKHFPDIVIVWGGYFPSNHHRACFYGNDIDFIINGPGEFAFRDLLKCLTEGKDFSGISNLIYQRDGQIVKNPKGPIPDPDLLPAFPYERLHKFYDFTCYLTPSLLGRRTASYHSSYGCPFTCSFCAVVPIYKATWKAKSPHRIYQDIKFLCDRFGADAVQFHDNNFFVSERRAVEFANLVRTENLHWWGEARVDTMDKYSDDSLTHIFESGCKMIFFGAESGTDAILQFLNKGGTQNRKQLLSFARRMKRIGIVPEYSFVLGTPGQDEKTIWKQIKSDVEFIKDVKTINPSAEIVIYIYSPVPAEDSALLEEARRFGFRFPQSLDEWLEPRWENFDLRKNPLTPWLTAEMIAYIRDFETVLNGYYPTASDIKLTPFERKTIRTLSSWRYHHSFYRYPVEIKILQKFWLKYRQPEIEGF
jgi:radical SAM superfamily enzyme YgiQ (UPF0313 family)